MALDEKNPREMAELNVRRKFVKVGLVLGPLTRVGATHSCGHKHTIAETNEGKKTINIFHYITSENWNFTICHWFSLFPCGCHRKQRRFLFLYKQFLVITFLLDKVKNKLQKTFNIT